MLLAALPYRYDALEDELKVIGPQGQQGPVSIQQAAAAAAAALAAQQAAAAQQAVAAAGPM